MALLKGNFIILFLALSFMFDVHPRSISSTGISVRYSVTTTEQENQPNEMKMSQKDIESPVK